MGGYRKHKQAATAPGPLTTAEEEKRLIQKSQVTSAKVNFLQEPVIFLLLADRGGDRSG